MKDTPVLYAWTTDRKYASEFKKQRDMTKFIAKEQDIPDNEYKDTIRDSIQYTHFQLDKIHLTTISDPPFGSKVSVDILGTWYEETSVVMNGDK
ncbi:MAG: hypothetical protein K2O54_08060, partial [Prevotella sp.]|nr:hypothetical protein [Prevotella sp.]